MAALPDSGFMELEVDFSATDMLSDVFFFGGYEWREDDNYGYLSVGLDLVVSKSKNIKAILFDVSLMKKDGEPSSHHAKRNDLSRVDMLRFIYTDEIPEDGIEFKKLLAAADMYDLSRLKLICAQKLWKTVSVDNLATTLVYAEMHGCPQLKKRCLEFFVQDKNFEEIVLTEGNLNSFSPLSSSSSGDMR
uniref:Uncharacterized protein n=1 Tax=Leersia perrieri TaxID=77586 RepID=A0A0D9X9Y3_9ORYZ